MRERPAATEKRAKARSGRAFATLGMTLSLALSLAMLAPGAHARTGQRSGRLDATAVSAPGVAQGSADLTVSVAASAPASAGQNLTYTLTATNKGPEKATRVSVTDLLSGVKATFVSATPSQGTCSIGGSKIKLRCKLGTIEAGASAQVAIGALPSKGGELVSVASIGGREADPDTSNQSFQLRTSVTETIPPVEVQVGGDDLSQAFQTKTTFSVKWTASDPGSGVASFDARYRGAALGQDLGSFVDWQKGATGKGAKFTGKPGSTYCFSVRATDEVGNTSDWSAERCTAVPLSVGSFSRTGPWLTTRKSGYYTGRYSFTSVKGASLLLAGLKARQLALLVARCPGCGTIQVFWKGKLVKTVSLASAISRKSQLVPLVSSQSLQSGSVLVKVLSTKKRVKIEGLGVSAVSIT